MSLSLLFIFDVCYYIYCRNSGSPEPYLTLSQFALNACLFLPISFSLLFNSN